MRKTLLIFLLSLAFYQVTFACEPPVPTLKVICVDASEHYIFLNDVTYKQTSSAWAAVTKQLPASCSLEVPVQAFETYLQDYLAAPLFASQEFTIEPISQNKLNKLTRANENIFGCTGYEFAQSNNAILYKSYIKPSCRVAEDFISFISSLSANDCSASFSLSPVLFIVQTFKAPQLESIAVIVGGFLFCSILVFGYYREREKNISLKASTIRKLLFWSVGLFFILIVIWELVITL